MYVYFCPESYICIKEVAKIKNDRGFLFYAKHNHKEESFYKKENDMRMEMCIQVSLRERDRERER